MKITYQVLSRDGDCLAGTLEARSTEQAHIAIKHIATWALGKSTRELLDDDYRMVFPQLPPTLSLAA